jgi:adenosylcobinamide-GDP ribazoletransferase
LEPGKHSDMKRLYSDFWLSVSFFTRLPTPTLHGEIDMARALAFAPVVGAGLGLIAGLSYLGSQELGLPAAACALIAVAGAILATGALHEDGLADCADGAGGRTAEARLEIMKDSRIGSFGAIALILLLGLRVAAILALPDPLIGLIAAHAGARGGFAASLRYLEPARSGGLAAMVGKPEARTAFAALAIAVGVAFWAGGAIPVIAGLAVGWLTLFLAKRWVGGVTGDALGAQAVLVEIAILLTLSAAR